MNTLTQKDINYVSDMVNNYPRKSLNYNSPIDIGALSLNKKVLSLNKLTHLNIEQVKLTPIIHELIRHISLTYKKELSLRKNLNHH